jgi:hypothetical protein
VIERAFAVVLVMTALVGCTGSGSGSKSARRAASSTTVPPSYVEVADAEAGFVMSLPPDWRRLPLDAAALQQQADAARATNPRLAATLAAVKDLLGSGARLVALTPDGTSEVNLLVVSGADGARLEDFYGPAMAQLQGRGATIESREIADFAGVSALRVTLRFPVPDGGGTVDEVQYYLLNKGRAYVLTLSGHDPALGQIASSLRLT